MRDSQLDTEQLRPKPRNSVQQLLSALITHERQIPHLQGAHTHSDESTGAAKTNSEIAHGCRVGQVALDGRLAGADHLNYMLNDAVRL